MLSPNLRRYWLSPLVEDYTDRGYDARLTPHGAVIVINGAVIDLGDKPQVISDSGAGGGTTKPGPGA